MSDATPDIAVGELPLPTLDPNVLALSPKVVAAAPNAPAVQPRVVAPAPAAAPKPLVGVPMQRADYTGGAPIPGTQHVVQGADGTSSYQSTPYTLEQRINPALGIFANAQNIHNPALRTLARIASGVGAAAVGAAEGTSGGAPIKAAREKEIELADKEKAQSQESQERSLRMQQETQNLNSQDLLHDPAGNVVGYKAAGQLHALDDNTPQNIKDLAAASKPKGGFSMKTINVMGPDGKTPMATDVFMNENEVNRLSQTPEFQQTPDKLKYLEDHGAVSRLTLGGAVIPAGSGSKPMPKLVPIGNGQVQMQDSNPQSATFGQKIGTPQRAGSSQLLTMVNPNDPSDIQYFSRDSKTGATAPVAMPGAAPGMVPAAVAGKIQQKTGEFQKSYVDKAMGVEQSFNMMDQAYSEYVAAKAKGQELPTGAQSMLALSTHLATTFGNVKGSRVTKDMIQEHLGARSVSDQALVAIQRLTNGDVLSPEQWKAFHELIGQSRQFTWQNVVERGAEQHLQLQPEWIQRAGLKTGKLGDTQVFKINNRVFDLAGKEHPEAE